MPPYDIRIFGDPVLKQRASDVADIDGKVAQLVDDMYVTMHEAPGVGLAAPQVGIQKRLFVYDFYDDAGPKVMINPEITETSGEWTYEEGCLSVPGLAWEIVRPKQVHITGYDLDGNEISVEADELAARCFQHELDHLDGVLLFDRMDHDTRKQALKTVRELLMSGGLHRPERPARRPDGPEL